MKVVIVESPAKAKAIQKYLGAGYDVLASYGHVRDLPSKQGSVSPDDGFKMHWEISEGSEKSIKRIVDAVKGADEMYLATDPDREGEAIAWHICEILRQKKLLQKVKVHRSVFHEITKKAVEEAIHHPRTLDQALIHAYLTRRALDYLVGFTLSPVLWHKLPGSRSAGRVQSVALRLIVDREQEIEQFTQEEYWTLDADFMTALNRKFRAKLTELDGEKIKKFSLVTGMDAAHVRERVEAKSYTVWEVIKKRVQRHPAPAFTTSTLQQEAARKLGFSASKTMRVAQGLYEGMGDSGGLITYMRTDSVHLSADAIQAFRRYLGDTMGEPYVPASPRVYKNKSKNAQEAHEAIRPTDITKPAVDLKGILDTDQYKLYDLIWKRALASQMASADIDQTSADVVATDHTVHYRAVGSVIVFDGFLSLYQEGKDHESEEEAEGVLPPLEKGMPVDLKEIYPEQHFTQPPPRYSEASLVKKLEELGIGRPSTYASIIQVLQARSYVTLDKKQFIPEDRGRLVALFLRHYFKRYVEYDFTAHMEDALDNISRGDADWEKTLADFWKEFSATVQSTNPLKISDVLTMLDHELESILFPEVDGKRSRECPECREGKLSLKLGKFGAFVGCDRYPDCRYTKPFGDSSEGEKGEAPPGRLEGYPKELGIDPHSQQPVTLRHGPYGFYIQVGEGDGKKVKPKRVSLPKNATPETFTYEQAVQLLALPREIGHHPETGELIVANVGRFGPYLKYQDRFISVKEGDILSLTLADACDIIVKSAAVSSAKPRFKKKAVRAAPRKSKSRKK